MEMKSHSNKEARLDRNAPKFIRKGTFQFLKLSPEIRNMIYHHIYDAAPVLQFFPSEPQLELSPFRSVEFGGQIGCNSMPGAALLVTCKSVYAEAKSLANAMYARCEINMHLFIDDRMTFNDVSFSIMPRKLYENFSAPWMAFMINHGVRTLPAKLWANGKYRFGVPYFGVGTLELRGEDHENTADLLRGEGEYGEISYHNTILNVMEWKAPTPKDIEELHTSFN